MENSTFSNNELGGDAAKWYQSDFFSKKEYLFPVGAILAIVLLNIFLFSAPRNFPVGSIVNIKEGASLRSISRILKTNDVIRSRVVFETLVIFSGGEKYVVSGDYLFERKISVFEAVRRILRGERNLAPVKVTIPEGFNVSDISKAFALRLSNFNEGKFLAEAAEGYLFPDTYFFLTTDSEKDVLRSMSENFEKKISPLRAEISSFGRTEKEIIIMASLIEKEAKGDADRKYISGILWKRLTKGMPLQVDADMSTYKTKGLPASPIANPGLEAIKAAIFPQSSPYLYYLHDKDGNIHYAKTFAEHVLNKQKYLK